MNFLIITHAMHKEKGDRIYSYAPYIREMNLWLKSVDSVTIIAPVLGDSISKIDLPYEHPKLHLKTIPSIQFTSLKTIFYALLNLPHLFFTLYKEMRKADHIHLRCPGNIGSLGCLVQVFFPKTPKTAKYAGNWDPESEQPLSYRIQKWLLSSSFFTKNMQVLVYGNWFSTSPNIKPFFTASFLEADKNIPTVRDYSNRLQFLFVGSLVEGKRPFYTIQLVERLHHLGFNVQLDLFGDGVLRESLHHYIVEHELENVVHFHGNQEFSIIKARLKSAHFLILPSKSEGWPKAVAEAMFFGVIPIATPVSCLVDMLEYGSRGVLIFGALDVDVKHITEALEDPAGLESISKAAAKWSQQFTLERFEREIEALLKN
ncbi:glycosyltransferase family 4 protein [Bizionia gelidisalsuginis]|uniref:Glycosyltransferase family 4 protein n=1 Tax=Bizionia gelidisalsuginis TaxID=291188 RepID=A0ABY3MDG6_9FLAO|nr:glycosyltransferase family 4 protein [Bizionia gelidisalsuginis]TYC17000.1 glycosyltransferase family 4 protein [Bizionia gelidisalsuginis]